ncbi:hypothetical protein [Paracoccus sp. (in: a-proteobacteria)]|uniref:hypothetical protein n=1 Tax=Paracoccus sp. TaxID=267 RepID=UPI0028972D6D|nr:hypothetical protein [Paracoccus sp. (in: a-proteobacteria)]
MNGIDAEAISQALKGARLLEPPRNINAEKLWGIGAPSEEKMEMIVRAGYFPGLNWEWFRWAYPKIEYDTATEMFLSAMYRAIEKRELYVMRPPHANNPLIGTKLIGNIITGQREGYWIADAEEVVRYFRQYWPHSELRDQALLDHFFTNYPDFCFPVPEEDRVSMRELPELDWNDCFLFP